MSKINFKELVSSYEDKLLKSIEDLVSIPSVYDENTVTDEMPYGKYINDALMAFKALGESYGFNGEVDKHYCELSLGNSGPLIEVFGHLDVVPVENDGNNYFKIRKEGETLYARGIADDKGPLLAAFFAAVALKENNLLNNCRIKFFAGGNEERGSSCLNYYVKTKKKEKPDYGFTPDSNFPIVYGEKGICGVLLQTKRNFKHVISINGGVAMNIVIPACTFKVDNINDIKDKIKAEHKINGDEITFIGKAYHGSQPQNGINAFLVGLKELGEINNDKEMLDLYDLFIDYNGKKLGCYYKTENLGETTYNIGVVKYENNVLEMNINPRYPETTSAKEIIDNLKLKLNAEILEQDDNKVLLFDLDSDLVKNLLDAYYAETNDTVNKPITSGGGTYAKEVENTIAFGAEFLGDNYNMHETKEHMKISQIFKTMQIYAHAIYNLANIKK